MPNLGHSGSNRVVAGRPGFFPDLFGGRLIILSFGQFKYSPLLKIDKPAVLVAMRITPGLEGRQVSGGAEYPLIIGIIHPLLQQLALVIEKTKGEIAGISIKPIDNKLCT